MRGEEVQLTRLSRFHPYPAMVADELALELAESMVQSNSRVLDPFCGAGRLVLAAAARGAACMAVDLNPLAYLITKAKTVSADVSLIGDVRNDIPHAKRSFTGRSLKLQERKVAWFSKRAIDELRALVGWINRHGLPDAERLVVAAALSATARQVSYCRKDGWKLHRLSAAERRHQSRSAWDVFAGKLDHYIEESKDNDRSEPAVTVKLGDARSLPATCRSRKFDVVLTSPPYGDSRTTIQYGAASALCLDVVKNIHGLEDLFQSGSAIDAASLGGTDPSEHSLLEDDVVTPYWAGRKKSEPHKRVVRFLSDMRTVCHSISRVLDGEGKVALIVGRRSVGGFRLKFDRFVTDELIALGFAPIETIRRRLSEKRLPRMINRFGAARRKSIRANGATLTMLDEYVLTFERR